MRGSIARRLRERLGECLERNLDDVVQVLALVEAQVQVAHRGAGERFEEDRRELDVPACRAWPSASGTLQTKKGRPERSMAAVTSASSMGSVAHP